MPGKQNFIFSFKDKIYGIRPETQDGKVVQYSAYLYELDKTKKRYIYQIALKRWKTLEIALMRYSIRGILCFPIYGERPDSVSEDEMLKLVDRGFDEMLKKTKEG